MERGPACGPVDAPPARYRLSEKDFPGDFGLEFAERRLDGPPADAGTNGVFGPLRRAWNQWELLEGERQTWLSLNGFNHATKLGPEDLIRLDELIFRAKTLNRFIVGDQEDFAYDKRVLGLHPSFGRLASTISPLDPEFCKPVIPAALGKAI